VACASPSPAAPPGSAAGEQVAEQPSDAEPLAVGAIEAAAVVTGEREWCAVERVPAAVAAMFEPGLQRNLEWQHEQADGSPRVDVHKLGNRSKEFVDLGSSRLTRGGYLEPYVLADSEVVSQEYEGAVLSVLRELP
jgi:hypothetical protein